MRHLLEIDDLAPEELVEVLQLGMFFSGHFKNPPQEPNILTDKGVDKSTSKGVALLFEKPSLRTRHSMEMAVVNLGGHPVSVNAGEIGMGSRESPSDVAKTLAGYHAILGARVFSHESLVEMANADVIPIVNMLSDLAHPLQALADILTIMQVHKSLENLKLAYVGDANNMTHSLAIAVKQLNASSMASDISLHIASPKGYEFSAQTLSDSQIVLTHDPVEAVTEADVVYTDVWASMGQEGEASKRAKKFQGFGVTAELMGHAKPNAMFMHCLPAHRGQEVEGDVIDGKQSVVWQQAHNRMYSAMGYLSWLGPHLKDNK